MEEVNKALNNSTSTNTSLVFLVAVDRHWDKYTSTLIESKKGLSFETVHSLRISVRRMRVLLQLMQRLKDSPSLNKPIRRLKRQSDDLDVLRDTQVMLKEVEGELPQMPSLKGFQDSLLEREGDAKRKVRKGFNKLKTKATLRSIVEWIESLDKQESPKLSAEVKRAIDETFQEVQKRYSAMNQADTATIHSLRVGFRKFRYMIEATEGLIPGFPVEYEEQMKQYQNMMGEVQDVQVLLNSLADYAAAAPGFDSHKAMDYFHHCLDEAVCMFLDHQDMLDTFWRLQPDQPFPWDKKE